MDKKNKLEQIVELGIPLSFILSFGGGIASAYITNDDKYFDYGAYVGLSVAAAISFGKAFIKPKHYIKKEQ